MLKRLKVCTCDPFVSSLQILIMLMKHIHNSKNTVKREVSSVVQTFKLHMYKNKLF